MNNNIINTCKYFESRLNKYAAKAGKTYKVPKILAFQEKAKEAHRKAREEFSALIAKKNELDAQVDEARSKYELAKKEFTRANRIVQTVDFEGASGIVEYRDDCVDVSYVIDGQEVYCTDDGQRIPIKEWRKQYRQGKKDSGAADTNTESANDEPGTEPDDEPDMPSFAPEDDEFEIDSKDLDNYSGRSDIDKVTSRKIPYNPDPYEIISEETVDTTKNFRHVD